MDCDLCGRLAGPHTRFHCPTCARNVLYPIRLEQLGVLAEKEAMGRMVEAATQATGAKPSRESLSLSGKIVDTHDCAKASAMDKILSDTVMTKDRLEALRRRAEGLRSEMEDYKRSINKQNDTIQRRRSDKGSATYGLLERESKEQEALQSSIRRIGRRWEMKHNDIVESRAALCKPAARLAGLRRHRRPREDGTMREYYTIATELPVFDLRELHTADHDVLTASLTHLTYLTVRAATYLALRLPAEIVLPHRDYPLPTIFPPLTSYKSRDVPFPGSTPTASTSNSPVASRNLDTRPLPTPRPLYLKMGLAKLLKDDSTQAGLFIEGATLLAWNIAWLCKTQGMNGIETEWDLCPMGRNLWNLLLTDGTNLRGDLPAASTAGNAELTQAPAENAPTRFGQLSHGTAHSFLASGDDKIISVTSKRVMARIRDFLINEMQKAEWEVVQAAEWNTVESTDATSMSGGNQR